MCVSFGDRSGENNNGKYNENLNKGDVEGNR